MKTKNGNKKKKIITRKIKIFQQIVYPCSHINMDVPGVRYQGLYTHFPTDNRHTKSRIYLNYMLKRNNIDTVYDG